MAPNIPRAEITLKYPVYTSSFDPNNKGFLLVGGGGGEGRSGVDNKITLLDTSQATRVREIHDIVLSRDEDSVTSLAIAKSSTERVTAYAGINSSSQQLAQGVNEHLRSFELPYSIAPTADEDDGGTEKPKSSSTNAPKALGKVALFEQAVGDQETYQRVLRLSRAAPGSQRLGAIATGLAPLGEVVVFDASKDFPSKADVRQRIKLQKGEEAADLDILETREGAFELVYCTDYDVCICTVSSKGKAQTAKPMTIYTTQPSDRSASKKRPTFRAVRFLTPKLLALIQNLPDRAGTDVILMEVPLDDTRNGNIILRKRLHRGIKSASSLATALLPAAIEKQNIQHVLAIAGQDISITILTLDHSPNSLKSLKLKKFTILKEVHPVQMTSLAFSNFVQPKDSRTAPPQHLKLASTSMGTTVVVHTLPLMAHPQLGKEPQRYCLSSPAGRAEVGEIGISILITLFMAAIGGVLIQVLIEIRGGSPEYLGAKDWLSPSLRDRLAVPYMFAEAPVITSSMPALENVQPEAVISEAMNSMPKVEELVAPMPEGIKQAILDFHTESKPLILHDTDDGVAPETHHDEEHLAQKGRKWEDLEHHEKHAWKERLTQAGEWTEGQLETVLKGVFFGELAGVVAGAIRG